jgi:hypothetical protein
LVKELAGGNEEGVAVLVARHRRAAAHDDDQRLQERRVRRAHDDRRLLPRGLPPLDGNQEAWNRRGANVMSFRVFLQRIWAKNVTFFAENTISVGKNYIVTVFLLEKHQFFKPKIVSTTLTPGLCQRKFCTEFYGVNMKSFKFKFFRAKKIMCDKVWWLETFLIFST